MDLASLLSYIDQNINTKYGVDKINGKLHNAVMRQVVSSLIEITATGFGGDLAPEQNPGTQTKPIYFMATETGTFTYCGGVEVTTIPAFVMWTGSEWSAKNIGLPKGVGEASKCQGLVFANDLQPSGKAVGDWYVFMGGGSINWGTAISSAGIIYLKSNTPTDSWGYVPFGGDARFRGIIDPGFDPVNIIYSNGDYYIARTGGDFSKFAGINIDSIKVTGKLTYNASSKNWTFSEFTGGNSVAYRAYSIDFNNTTEIAQEINMLGAAEIISITTNNVALLQLTYSGGVKVTVNPTNPGITITNGDVLTWEISRTTANTQASIGIKILYQ